MNSKPYHYEIPIPPFGPTNDVRYKSYKFGTIEECVEACKAGCKDLGVDYNHHDVKLFMTDSDGTWEVTKEGELAG